jgi:hypothetical protein
MQDECKSLPRESKLLCENIGLKRRALAHIEQEASLQEREMDDNKNALKDYHIRLKQTQTDIYLCEEDLNDLTSHEEAENRVLQLLEESSREGRRLKNLEKRTGAEFVTLPGDLRRQFVQEAEQKIKEITDLKEGMDVIRFSQGERTFNICSYHTKTGNLFEHVINKVHP